MHEWALAEGVVTTSVRVAEEQGLEEITEVTVSIGELQQIEHDIFRFALEQLRHPIMKNAKFVFESIGARLKCRVCGDEWGFSPNEMDEEASEAIHFLPEVAHAYLACTSCGSPDFQVLEGRGVILSSIKGMKVDD